MREQRRPPAAGPCCGTPPVDNQSERVKLRSDMIQVVRDQHVMLQEWACQWERRSAKQLDDYSKEVARLLAELREEVRELGSHCKVENTDEVTPGPAQKGPAGLQIPLSAVWSQGPSVAISKEEFGAKVIDLVPSFDIQSSPHIQRLRRNEESRKKHVLNRFKKVRRKGSVMIEESVVLDQSDLVRFVESNTFEAVVAGLIFLNILVGGYEMDTDVRLAFNYPPGDLPGAFRIANLVFGFLFTVELIIRMYAFRRRFFAGDDWAWNVFDLAIVLTQWVEEAFRQMNINQLRIIRLARAVRTLRVVRVIHVFRSLRLLVLGVFHSMLSLVWAVSFLFLVMYLFSMTFAHATSAYLREENMIELPPATGLTLTDVMGPYELRLTLEKNFPDLGRILFSLLMSVSGGVDWYELVQPLMTLSPFYGLLFTLFVVFVIFGMMNVLNAVFIDHTLRITDRDLLINEEQGKTDNFLQDMRDLFHEAGGADAGQVSRQQLVGYLRNERVLSYMEGHQLDVSDVENMFRLLDVDKSGCICEEEWLLGTLRLKGQARCLDVMRVFTGLDTMMQHVSRIEAALGLPPELQRRSSPEETSHQGE